MSFSLCARVVFPVDRPPIEHGVVTIEGERIVAVGDKADGELIDLGQVALLPGLVNAHTHLEFSYLERPLGRPGMSFADWIRLVISERSHGQPADNNPYCGLFESHRYGVTTIGDISVNVRTISLVGDVTHFHEVIGFSRARSESAMKVLVERMEALQVISKRRVHQGISPHAPYTVSAKLLEALVLHACRQNVPVAMHLAESSEELELLRDGTGAFQKLLEERSMWDAEAIPHHSRTLDYLRMLWDAPRSLVIHGNYLDEEELQFLAAKRERMSLVYCPRTHAYFFHSAYPLEQALTAGVRVALGTDSRASNPDLSLLSEMRHVARAYPAIDRQTVLRMGTLDGAEALGRHHEVGSMSMGKLANLVAISLPNDARGTASDMLAAILADESAPSAVYLAGRRL